MIHEEIQTILKKKVLIECRHEKREFVSPIFTVTKSNGDIRLILNLKKLNKSIKFKHFKMDSIQSVLTLRKNCFMASVDLKVGYFSVNVDESYQSFLKFSFDGKLYQYTCFPNGLAPLPKKVHKIE